MTGKLIWNLLFCTSVVVMGCGDSDPARSRSGGGADTTIEAVPYEFEFSGELDTNYGEIKANVAYQLRYTVGIFDSFGANGRLDWIDVVSAEATGAPDQLTHVRYRVKFPVMWRKSATPPSTFELLLPRRLDETGIYNFADRYSDKCGGDIDFWDSFWHDYNPNLLSCSQAIRGYEVINALFGKVSDVVRTTATVRPMPPDAAEYYPEYDKIWDDDDSLNVVAVYATAGIAATVDDSGLLEYEGFIAGLRKDLPAVVTTPTMLSDEHPALEHHDITLDSTLADGKKVHVRAFLTNGLPGASDDLKDRIVAASRDADFIYYGGHSGYGGNINIMADLVIRAMSPTKYQMLFLDGCNSWTYLDHRLVVARAAASRNNPPLPDGTPNDDPNGTRFLDVMANVLPAPFFGDGRTARKLVNYLREYRAPRTYSRMLSDLPTSQIVIVTGDEDNEFGRSPNPGR